MAKQNHGDPLKSYLLVFFTLLILTGITVWVSMINFGALNVPIALTIASVKALCVVLVFMHLAHSEKLNWVFAFNGIFWLFILMLFTLSDFLSRGWLQ